MKNMKLKINNVPGYSGTVTIQADANGIPLERFWRNRLKDAKFDQCVEVVKPSRAKTKQEKAE